MAEPLNLEPIKEREKKATPGPWRLPPQGQTCGNGVVLCDSPGDPDGMGFEGGVVGAFPARRGRISTFEARIHEADSNASFCAHARQDIPALVSEVERLREALKAIDRAAKHSHGNCADFRYDVQLWAQKALGEEPTHGR